MPRYRFDDDDVVVIVGSGAGGGTLANELCQKGVKVVVLEAGRHHTPDDFVNDEWRSFKQLAWLDKRTTSGSFRDRARTSPTCPPGRARPSAARRCTGPAAARASWSTSSRPRPTTAASTGANALDWPISLADVEPYYDRAEAKLGITGTNGIPQLPANNNYKVFANGAQRVGYKRFHTGRYAVNPVPRDGRPATIQDGFTLPGRQGRREVVDARRRAAQGAGDRQARPAARVARDPRSSTTSSGLATGVTYIDGDGLEQFQRARLVSRRRQRDRDRRGCCSTRPRACSRTAWRTPPARSAATTCAT